MGVKEQVITYLKNIIGDRKKRLVAIAVLLIGTVILARTVGRKDTETQTQIAPVEKGTIVSSVSASGNVLMTNVSSITTTATGVVTKVYVTDGDTVATGAKLADVVLDSDGAQKHAAAWSGYLTSKNALDSSQITLYSLRSAKDTAWKKYIDLATNATYQNSDGSARDDIRSSSAEFQSMEADWLAAEGKYKNQEAVIAQTRAALQSSWLSYRTSAPTVTAPMSGTVTNIGIVEGMVLSSQDSGVRVAVITMKGNPLISVNLSEIDVLAVGIGQKATVTVDSLPDKTFTGTVASVDRLGTVASGVTNYSAIIKLDTGSDQLLPNMAASANVIIETKSDVLLVPSGAVQGEGDQSYVIVLKDNREQNTPVTVGISSDTQTEITSGLSEGDEVLTGTVSVGTQNRSAGTSPFGGFGGTRFIGR